MTEKEWNRWEAKQLRQTLRNIGVKPDYIDTRSIKPLVREWRVNFIGGCSSRKIALIKKIPGFIKMSEYGKRGHIGPWCYYGQHFWFEKGSIQSAAAPVQPVLDRVVKQRFYIGLNYIENNKAITPYCLCTTKREAGRNCYVVEAVLNIMSQNHPSLK